MTSWRLCRLLTAMAQRLTSASEYKSLLDNYDTWLFDCDGVLWHGDRLIDGALEVLDLLRNHRESTELAHPIRNLNSLVVDG